VAAPDDAADRDARGEVEPPDVSRDALFDLAVARADSYLRRARRPVSNDPEDVRRALEPWALKTRFASRLDLAAVARAVAARPAGDVRWCGGQRGGWS
jgi:hypothetical protein